MARLTSLLQKMMYRRAVTPIIVETSHLKDLRIEISQLLPNALKDLAKTFLPRLTQAAETTLATLDVIPTFNMLSFPATSLIIEELAQDRRVNKMYYDRMMWALQKTPVVYDPTTRKNFATTRSTKYLLGIDQANAEGWTGRDVCISIIDSGSGVHKQLSHVQHHTTMEGMYSDGSGHGTHVISIVAGKLVQDPIFKASLEGMAPQAFPLSIKALGYIIGVGKESDCIEALELSQKLGAQIVNMSLGSEEITETLEDDPLAVAIEKLTTEYNMIICCAAGNSGPSEGSINSPGSIPEAFTVGALDEINTGEVADFSSRGPTPWGVKPDVISPGVNVYSACVNLLDIQGDKKPQRYSYLSGTSQATPHVTGLLACARQMFQSKGIILNRTLVEDICREYGHEKNNTSGYGLCNWSWFKRYFEEHL